MMLEPFTHKEDTREIRIDLSTEGFSTKGQLWMQNERGDAS